LSIKQIKDAGSEFAIIKLTEGNFLIDSAAFGFYHEAFTMGFPVGCYCYSHATTAEQARREAEFLLKTINGFPMPCGVFLDIEEPKMLELDHDAILNVIRGWCAGIGGKGYIPGVYSSEGTLWSKISPDELPDGCLVWVAKWSETQPNTPCDLWQNSDNGRVEGYEGPVDTDVARSERFMALVNLGMPKKEEPPDVSDACPIDGPCGESPLDIVAAFLRTDACRDLFKAYIAGKENKS
jgi:GH25 family lysozyme M1 (1,4-beta-N-acetylmuramidase)